VRLLPYVRLSVLDDASTSPERQLEKIHYYARFGDHELVPITEADYDSTSAARSARSSGPA
jgi:DNA invertase Pin-like site-specific DNA recombinase